MSESKVREITSVTRDLIEVTGRLVRAVGELLTQTESTTQTEIDELVSSLNTALSSIASEWSEVEAQLQAEGTSVDLSKLQAAVSEAQSMASSWAPASPTGPTGPSDSGGDTGATSDDGTGGTASDTSS